MSMPNWPVGRTSVAGSERVRSPDPQRIWQRRGDAKAKCDPRGEEEKEHGAASRYQPGVSTIMTIPESSAWRVSQTCNTANKSETQKRAASTARPLCGDRPCDPPPPGYKLSPP